MRTIRIKLYKFSELSKKAQAAAIEEYRNDTASEPLAWADENRDSLDKFAEIFPIEVREAYYGDRGEGVSFYFTCEDAIEELSGQRLATYIWNNYKDDLYKGKYFKSWTSKERVSHRKVKSQLISKATGWTNKEIFGQYWNTYSGLTLEHSCVLTGYYMDDEILEPIYKFLDKPRDINFKDLLEECFNAWVKAGNSDIEDQNSDEYITDTITSNDYEFTKDGKRN